MEKQSTWSLWNTSHRKTQDLTWNLAVSNPSSTMYYKYWDAYVCGSIQGFRCNTKWCYWCNMKWSIKTSFKYLDELESFEDAHFVTLTSRKVNYNDFTTNKIKEYQKRIGDIIKASKRTLGHGKGVRKFEITYSKNSSYPKINMHYHIITDSLELANIIRERWIKANEGSFSRGQQVSVLTDKDEVRKSLFYCLKSPVPIYKSSNFYALDKIFLAIKGIRIIQPFGLKPSEVSDERKTEITNKVYEWQSRYWKNEPLIKRKPYHKDIDEYIDKLNKMQDDIETTYRLEIMPKLDKICIDVNHKFGEVSLYRIPKLGDNYELYYKKKNFINKAVFKLMNIYVEESKHPKESTLWLIKLVEGIGYIEKRSWFLSIDDKSEVK
jgi:hypothetical protein